MHGYLPSIVTVAETLKYHLHIITMLEICSHYQTHLKILIREHITDIEIYLVSLFQDNWSFVTLCVCSRVKYCKFSCE